MINNVTTINKVCIYQAKKVARATEGDNVETVDTRLTNGNKDPYGANSETTGELSNLIEIQGNQRLRPTLPRNPKSLPCSTSLPLIT